MNNRKHKLSLVILGIFLIGLIGFKDTGIFVKDFVSIKDDGVPVFFIEQENVNVLREFGDSYLIEKNSVIYEIPMEVMIRTNKTTQKFEVINETHFLDKLTDTRIRLLEKGEILQVLSYNNDFGLFNTEDGIEGNVRLEDVQVVVSDYISYGTAKVDKVIKNEGSFYTLIKGEVIGIKNYIDKNYIVVDDKGTEFKVKESWVELSKTREKATRSNVSRRSSSVNKIIEAAHSELGKPYIGGSIGPKGFDCSGLTYSLFYNQLNIKLNRSSGSQSSNGVKIEKADLIPGDLVFFTSPGKKNSIGHVGLYIGDGNMIHASSGRNKIMITALSDAYYLQRYVTARRIINNK